MKKAESFPKGQKTLREKEKLLVTSNFSFSYSVFKRLILQTRKNQGLFGKGLTLNDKIGDQSNLKAFADNILNVVQMIICASDWVENAVGKGENVGYHHFLFFHNVSKGPLKVGIVW